METLCRIETRDGDVVASGVELLEALDRVKELGPGHGVVREADGEPLAFVASVDGYNAARRSLERRTKTAAVARKSGLEG